MTTNANGVSLEQEGSVFLLSLGDGENRFNPHQIEAIESALRQVEAAEGPRSLVTVAIGKFWSNGLDLDWMGSHPDQLQSALDRYHQLLGHMLGASVPTIAAVQGHAFAAGAMFATAHDLIVMREDRGYWCLPEVDLKMPFTPGMTALLQARLPRRTAHIAMTTGHRYTGPEAAAAGIVDDIATEAGLRTKAVELAASLASKDAATLQTIKQRMYAPALATLEKSQTL